MLFACTVCDSYGVNTEDSVTERRRQMAECLDFQLGNKTRESKQPKMFHGDCKLTFSNTGSEGLTWYFAMKQQ